MAQHYEQTYDHVNHQIDLAQQHMMRRKSFSPERPMSRRPKNRVSASKVLLHKGLLIHTQSRMFFLSQNSNILSSVLCLIKELDGPSLEVAEMAIRCRMEELDE